MFESGRTGESPWSIPAGSGESPNAVPVIVGAAVGKTAKLNGHAVLSIMVREDEFPIDISLFYLHQPQNTEKPYCKGFPGELVEGGTRTMPLNRVFTLPTILGYISLLTERLVPDVSL